MTMAVTVKLAGHEVPKRVSFKTFCYWEVSSIPVGGQILKTVKFYIRKEKQLGLDTTTGI